jgi:hypothetical protein
MILRHTSLPRAGWNLLVILLCSAIPGLVGCGLNRAPKSGAPLTAPAVEASVRHHAGSPLARPTTRAIDPTAVAADAPSVQVQWLALEKIPAGLATITPNARLIAVPTSTRPIAAGGQLIGQVRLVKPDDVESFLANVQSGKFGRSVEIAQSRGALPADVTAVFALTDSAAGDMTPRRGVEVTVYRTPNATGGDQMQLGLAISDPPRRERALLDPIPLGTGTKWALVIPARKDGTATDAKATLAVIDIARQTGPEQSAALAACVKDLSSLPAMAGTSSQIPASADWTGIASALRTISTDTENTRPALIFLAGQTNATLCSDVALLADEATLNSLAKRIITATGGSAGPAPMEKAKLGWILDSACFAELAAMQAEEKTPPELAAVLTAYAGEAGRHAASLDEIVKGLSSREQLEAQLMAENLVYLEDASPAARVRAYDWLASKNSAPAGYDPLGSNKDRRDALDKSITAAPAAAKQPPGGAK